MKRWFAALLVTAAFSALAAALAQDAAPPTEKPLAEILSAELSPETLDLAMQLVRLSGTARDFDNVLPDIADQAKNAFIRSNPQMQLGIITVVDRVALTLVSRRPELDNALAHVWAAAFTNEEMQELIDFFSTDTGKKFAGLERKLLAVELATAQQWGQSVGAELKDKVTAELRASMQAEQDALQSGAASTNGTEPAPAQ
jgi:hypothetical protein